MKYIRTKDGRIWESCNLTENSKDLWEGFFVKGNYIYEKIRHWEYGEKYKIEYRKINAIIKQADTIEELCDLYVIWLKNRELPLIERTQKGRRLYPSYFEVGECSFDKGYGAIWTDKGLIYVAKMNEKGDLELL